MAAKTTKNEKVWMVINCLVLFMIGFGTFSYKIDPSLSDFRNSIYGLIVNCLVLAGIILWVTLSRIIRMPLSGKITVWTYGLLYILLSLFDLGKIEPLFFFLYAIVNVCVVILLYKKHGVVSISILFFGLFSYLKTALIVLRVEYLRDEFASPVFWVAIAVSILVLIPCLIYAIKHFFPYRDWAKLIGIPLGVLLISFALVWMTISSMNVYLDPSDPTYEEYVIVDKDIKAGSRQATTYEFEVKKDGVSFTIGVSETTYYSHEVNDTIPLSVYSGAFKEPYYMVEED